MKTVRDGIKTLTRFQRPVYDHIVMRTIRDGSPPTMREIGLGLDLSPSNVYHHFHKIMDVGLIRRDDQRFGYIVVGMNLALDWDAPLYKPEESQ